MLVRNPASYFNLSQPRYISIRDTYSYEYQLRKMYQLQTRSVVHFYDYMKRGYNLYFFTLTYSNDNLSWFHFDNGKYKTLVRCFDRDLVIKFFKDIRKYCDRYYSVHDIPYLFADERGGKKKRPHHHLLIAFPSSMSLQDVYNVISYNWSYVQRDDEGHIVRDDNGYPIRNSLGFILPSTPEGDMWHRGILVEPSNFSYACRYASKYCLKCLDDDKDRNVALCLSYILHDKDYDTLAKFRRSQTKIKLSRYFGASLENYVNSFDDMIYGVDIPEISDSCKITLTDYNLRRLTRKLVVDRIERDYKVNSSFRLHPIYCKYILRKQKKFFNRYFYKSVLNDLGKEFEYYKYDYVIDQLSFRFKQLKSLILSDSVFFDTFEILSYDSVRSLLDCDLHSVAVYSYVYRNRVSPSHLELYNSNRNIFDSYHLLTDIVPIRRGRGYIYVDHERYYKDFKFVVAPFYASCAFLPQPNDWELPTGSESIKTLVDFGKSFKCLQCEYDYKDFVSTVDCTNYNLYFNSFPAFRGFDDILSIFELYKFYKSSKYRTICESIDFVSSCKHEIFENDDMFNL